MNNTELIAEARSLYDKWRGAKEDCITQPPKTRPCYTTEKD